MVVVVVATVRGEVSVSSRFMGCPEYWDACGSRMLVNIMLSCVQGPHVQTHSLLPLACWSVGRRCSDLGTRATHE